MQVCRLTDDITVMEILKHDFPKSQRPLATIILIMILLDDVNILIKIKYQLCGTQNCDTFNLVN